MLFFCRKGFQEYLLFYLVIISFVTLAFPRVTISQQTKKPLPIFKKKIIDTKTGWCTLSWDFNATKEWSKFRYILQQSNHKDFLQSKDIYSGLDQGTFISGLSEGVYFYRVKAVSFDNTIETSWSESVRVTVSYQSMTLAWILFTLGFIIFVSIAFVVIRGSRNHL